MGGMALLSFMYYYWAANIRVWLYWLRTSMPSWVTLERASITSSSSAALLSSQLPFQQPISTYSSNPVVVHTVKIRNQCRRSFGFTRLWFNGPVTKNHMFIPSVTDEAFNIWALNGLHSLYNLYIDNKFASFEQLVEKFNIQKSGFTRCSVHTMRTIWTF